MGSDLYHPYLLGGGERRMYEIAIRLAKKHEVHIITRKFSGLPAYEICEGVHIHRVPVPSGAIKLESPTDGSAFMAGALIGGLKLGDFDVYAPQQFFPLPPLFMVARTRKRPIVATIHDVYRETWLQKYGLKGSLMAVFEKVMLKLPYTKIVTVSSASKQKLIESGVASDKIVVIPNGVDLSKFEKVRVRKSQTPRVIYIGRLIGYKHVDDLFVAFSKLGFEAELYVVGEGPERGKLEKLAAELGIKQRVVFTGFVDEHKKIELLKSSHVLVLPSTTEGFGIVLIESMAAGTPVIAADIPALREVTANGEAGLLFPPRDIEELTMKLGELLTNQNLQRRLIRCGFEQAKKFTWDHIAQETEKILLDCINR
jgi:glycosyltransferase involved in cell wall biosynthesis